MGAVVQALVYASFPFESGYTACAGQKREDPLLSRQTVSGGCYIRVQGAAFEYMGEALFLGA